VHEDLVLLTFVVVGLLATAGEILRDVRLHASAGTAGEQGREAHT
jgi:hypothetical protein